MLRTGLYGLLLTALLPQPAGNELLKVRMGRLELPQHCCHRYLKPARLPIPPHPRGRPLSGVDKSYNMVVMAPQNGFYRDLPVPPDQYKGTTPGPSQWDWIPQTRWYDRDLHHTVDSGSA